MPPAIVYVILCTIVSGVSVEVTAILFIFRWSWTTRETLLGSSLNQVRRK